MENNEIKLDDITNVDTRREEKKSNKADGAIEILSSGEDSKAGKDKKIKKSKKKKARKEKKKKVIHSYFYISSCFIFNDIKRSNFFQKKRKKGKDSENSATVSEESSAEDQTKKLKSVLKQNITYPSSSTGR